MKKIDWKQRKGLLALIVLVGIMCVYLVAAEITPSLNLNGQNRFTITNYSSITGIGNLSVGSGTEFADIYSNGTIVIFDSKGYNITFTDGIKWSELTVYPVACPAESYLTQLGDSVTCTAIQTISNNITISGMLNASTGRLLLPLIKATTPAVGSVMYNSTLQVPCFYNGTNWYQSNKTIC